MALPHPRQPGQPCQQWEFKDISENQQFFDLHQGMPHCVGGLPRRHKTVGKAC